MKHNLSKLPDKAWPWLALVSLVIFQAYIIFHTVEPETGLIIHTNPEGAEIFRLEPELFLAADASSSGGNREIRIGQSPGPLHLATDELPLTILVKKLGYKSVERHLPKGSFAQNRTFPQIIDLAPNTWWAAPFTTLKQYIFGILGVGFGCLLGLGVHYKHSLRKDAVAEEAAVYRGTLKPGMHIGAYKIQERVGAGGMGQIFRVIKDTVPDESLALKLLDAPVNKEQQAQSSFLNEVRATAQIEHPGLLLLYDWGEFAQRYYMVTELLQGRTLREKLDDGPLGWKELVRIGLQVANTLSAVHQKKLIHRDIKPSNIFLTKDGKIKVMDMGVAASVGETGRMSGTIGYAPAEQLSGAEVKASADIYALGATLSECLLNRQVGEQSPSEISWPDDTPSALTDLLVSMTAKQPHDRPQSMNEVEKTLEALFNDP